MTIYQPRNMAIALVGAALALVVLAIVAAASNGVPPGGASWKSGDKILAYVFCLAEADDPSTPVPAYYELRQLRQDESYESYGRLMTGTPDSNCYDMRLLGQQPAKAVLVSQLETVQVLQDRSRCLATWRMTLVDWTDRPNAYVMLNCVGRGL